MLENNKRELLVAEVSGPYGDFIVPEQSIQKIWADQSHFLFPFYLNSGEPLEIINPGEWNHLEGPDFKNAQIKIGGKTVFGDIEIHIYPEDWLKHGHESDRNYRNVVLHISVFSGNSSSDIPHLTLLPYMSSSLEEIVNEVALSKISSDLLHTDVERISLDTLLSYSKYRWRQKVNYCKKRFSEFGFKESMHQLFLESLGSKRNREAMAEVAIRFPAEKLMEAHYSAEDLFNASSCWKLNGIRPLAHPKKRLEAYVSLFNSHLGWLDEQILRDLFPFRIEEYESVKAFRKMGRTQWIQNQVRERLLGSKFSESYVNTLICDVILPVLAAQEVAVSYFDYWNHWYVGNLPKAILRMGSKYELPLTNGLAQGILHSAIMSD